MNGDPIDSGQGPGGNPLGDVRGSTIGRYEIRALLGSGGAGHVFKAWDPSLQRWVALKRLRGDRTDDRERGERLLREARAASALRHPAIVSIHDVFEHDGEGFLVEEFVEGPRLRDRLLAPFPLPDFLDFAEECAGALARAAEGGVVHCDLKPENIMVSAEGRPRILDFGLAWRHREARPAEEITIALDRADVQDAVASPRAGPLEGTPAYLAPERIRGATPDARSDLFSLGVIFYEMLAARHPFQRETTAATLAAILRATPPPPSTYNPSVPPGLDSLIGNLLEKDPAARCASAASLLETLREIRSRAAGPETPIRSRSRRVLARAWKPALAIAVLLVLLVVVTTRLHRSPALLAGSGIAYLVVEPFRSLSPTPADTVFALGLTEAVQTRLAEMPGIEVAASSADPGAPFRLEGTVQRSQNRLRIACRVVESKRGAFLGGAIAEGDAGDLFALQDRVTTGVMKTLERRLHLGPPPPADPRPTADVTAYGYYLQGRGYLQRPGEADDHLVAVGLFEKALAIDPGFVLAQAGLAQAYWKLFEDSRDPAWAARAEEAAEAALKLAPRLAEVHIALGTIYEGKGEAARAAGEFRRALEIDPRDGEAFVGLANAQKTMGDLTAAERTFREAIAARPGDWSPWSQLGAFYFAYGRLDEARRCFEQVIGLTPDNARGYANLGGVLQEQGLDAEAMAAYETSLRIKPGYRALANLATLYRSQRRFADAARTYEQALAIDDHDYRVWGSLGSTYRLIPGRRATADSAYRRAVLLAEGQLEVNSRDPLLLALLAQYRAELADTAAARAAAERALEFGGSRPDVLVFVCAAYAILRDRASALRVARRAIELGSDPESWSRDPNMDELVNDPEFRSLTETRASEKGERAR